MSRILRSVGVAVNGARVGADRRHSGSNRITRSPRMTHLVNHFPTSRTRGRLRSRNTAATVPRRSRGKRIGEPILRARGASWNQIAELAPWAEGQAAVRPAPFTRWVVSLRGSPWLGELKVGKFPRLRDRNRLGRAVPQSGCHLATRHKTVPTPCISGRRR